MLFHFHYQKQDYLNILKFLPPKNENFQIEILIFFIFLIKTLICSDLSVPVPKVIRNTKGKHGIMDTYESKKTATIFEHNGFQEMLQ